MVPSIQNNDFLQFIVYTHLSKRINEILLDIFKKHNIFYIKYSPCYSIVILGINMNYIYLAKKGGTNNRMKECRNMGL